MNYIVAKDLMEKIMELNTSVNEVILKIDKIDKEERKHYDTAIADIMGTIYIELMIPIIREYPDLDPDKDADWVKNKRTNMTE